MFLYNTMTFFYENYFAKAENACDVWAEQKNRSENYFAGAENARNIFELSSRQIERK